MSSCATAMKSADSVTNRPATPMKLRISHRTACTRLRAATIASAETTARKPNIQNARIVPPSLMGISGAQRGARTAVDPADRPSWVWHRLLAPPRLDRRLRAQVVKEARAIGPEQLRSPDAAVGHDEDACECPVHHRRDWEHQSRRQRILLPDRYLEPHAEHVDERQRHQELPGEA